MIPETARRGIKFATRRRRAGRCSCRCPPTRCAAQAKANIIDQSKFDVPMHIRPDKGRRRRGRTHADRSAEPDAEHRRRAHLVQGAERTARARRVARAFRLPARSAWAAVSASGRSPFPTRHPLYIGPQQPQHALPRQGSTCCSISATATARSPRRDQKLISIRFDPTSLARTDAGRPRHGGRPQARDCRT